MEEKIKEILQKPYHRIYIQESEGGFSAFIAEFPGSFAMGDTFEEAQEHLSRVAESWLLACLETGRDIPPPKTLGL
jgi:predicted RNase H-like HicB family nuclease